MWRVLAFFVPPLTSHDRIEGEVRLKLLTLHDQMAVIVPRADKTGPDIDALLPLKNFETVAFDMERMCMIVTPRR